MKVLLTFGVIINYFMFFGQTLIITAKDEQGQLVNGFSVFKNSFFIGKTTEFTYPLVYKMYDTITIKKDGMVSDEFVALTLVDSLTHIFSLIPNIRDKEEVLVKYEKYNRIAGGLNENVIDYFYYPDRDVLMILKSLNGAYYIEKKTAKGSSNYPLAFKPQSLFLDALGNTHILSIDTAYQIWLEDSLLYVSKLSRTLFDVKIKPLIAKNTKYVFYDNYSDFNQCYVLSKTDTANKVSLVYKSLNKEASMAAKDEYNEIVNLYNKETAPINNVILNGTWDGNMVSLGETWQLIQKIAWFIHVRSLPIKCYSFGMNDCLVIVNFYEGEVRKFDWAGAPIDSVDIDSKRLKNIEIHYDFFYDSIYVYGVDNNAKEIFHLNVDTGKLNLIGNLNQIEPTQIKIIGNYAYFLSRNETGFNKLYKMKIDL